MTKREWKNLLRAMNSENCILLLGPNISGKQDGETFVPFTQLLVQKLVAEELEKETYDATHANDLAYIANVLDNLPNASPTESAYEAYEFYNTSSQQPNEIQELLANLPISMIINTSPDDLIVKALKKTGKHDVQFMYYDFSNDETKKNVEKLRNPSVTSPLVYNLFGYYKQPTSLVISELHQLIFTEKIVKQEPHIPDKVMGYFKSPVHKFYLFLGFDWEQWHLRLLLNSLNLRQSGNNAPRILASYPLQRKISHNIKNFYHQSFNFTFVDNQPIAFVKTLQQKYQEYVWQENTQQKIFLAFDREDKEYVEKIRKHLEIGFSKEERMIWHQGMLWVGDEKDKVIRNQLAKATTIILLISVDFLNNSTIRKREWEIAIKRFQGGEIRLIPIIIRPCNWKCEPILPTLDPILPKQNQEVKAISLWDNQEEAYYNIAKEL